MNKFSYIFIDISYFVWRVKGAINIVMSGPKILINNNIVLMTQWAFRPWQCLFQVYREKEKDDNIVSYCT